MGLMADKKNKQVQEEKKIPVFTVLKNGTILKNIYLLDSPSSISEEPKSIESGENGQKSWEEILVVGRHPDCNIMLEHPSISRSHLRICSQPSLQKLSVMDLSSAHGTWVSGQKIEPQVVVELTEGDTLSLGASTRVYRLHWMPLSQVYNVANPVIYPSDALKHEEEEEETYQDENLTPVVKGMSPAAPPPPETLNSSFTDKNSIRNPFILPSADALQEEDDETYWDENSSFPHENSMAFANTQILSAPPMPESINSSSPDEEEAVQHKEEVKSAGEKPAREKQSPPRRILDQKDISNVWYEPVAAESVNLSLPVEEILLEIGASQLDKENRSPEVLCSREVLTECENQETPLGRPEVKSSAPNLWSRRGKAASVLQIQTGRSKGKCVGADANVLTEAENQKAGKENSISRDLFPHLNGEEIFTLGEENFSPNTLLVKSMNLCTLSSAKITANSEVAPEEQFSSSDKENQTPMAMALKERKSEVIVSQNQARLETGISKVKREAEGVLFQSLLSNSISKSRPQVSVPNATTKSSYSVNCTQSIQKDSNPSANQSHKEAKKWNMVVDTTCLLDKDSRRSLKLLQGLKGTQLIIPRMVIRELDSLKRRKSLFRKTSDVSLALKWIEECMVKTKWWIHVQSSMEEPWPIAQTPPVSPCLSEASNGGRSTSLVPLPFSSFGSLTQIVSLTEEDHILEYALSFKRIRNDGQLILLTDNVTLKIKAMAEGLLCETAKEFRESLVNPYSERFLWAESTPRGPTWSCEDDIVLREKYYKFPIKKSSLMGLKLILFHNSHCGLINPVK
ncbi:FHA domain-containing protein PS1-like isoform X2 [Macadamia integrifolia]|uniref:FHA domain-containing protein PS1-like isoform X2 n=1 Tax=Macadamia integrifolia TaxID=60698 RepID=UPI001C4FA530|nr:FHA domain-containing protein PS1-like isoform X2 [Macadamia integrifolia]